MNTKKHLGTLLIAALGSGCGLSPQQIAEGKIENYKYEVHDAKLGSIAVVRLVPIYDQEGNFVMGIQDQGSGKIGDERLDEVKLPSQGGRVTFTGADYINELGEYIALESNQKLASEKELQFRRADELYQKIMEQVRENMKYQ